MKVNFVNCSKDIEEKTASLGLFFRGATRNILKKIITDNNSTKKHSSKSVSSINEYVEVQNMCDDAKSDTLTSVNTASNVNLSNLFNKAAPLGQSEKFTLKKTELRQYSCNGHECLVKSKNLDEKILFQEIKRKLRRSFTPPINVHSGIIVCPEPRVELLSQEAPPGLSDRNSSVLSDDIRYRTPGNMEFIDFTYPKVGHCFRYTTFAIPKDAEEWKWICNHCDNIKNSFRRKYHCELRLATKAGLYKRREAYLVQIESEEQGNFLSCRSGLPTALKNIMITPFNAINDVNCYITEYLLKRKAIFPKMPLSKDSNYSNYSNKKESSSILKLSSEEQNLNPKDVLCTKTDSNIRCTVQLN